MRVFTLGDDDNCNDVVANGCCIYLDDDDELTTVSLQWVNLVFALFSCFCLYISLFVKMSSA